MGRDRVFVVSQSDQGKRFDRFLQEQDLPLSRSRIKELITHGEFRVNDRHVKPASRLRPGDRVRGVVPAPRPLGVRAEDIPLDILHEDPHIIVVNKAAGMIVHPAPGISTGTLVNALLFHCKDLSGINGVLRPGIVHRLDRYTSGVIVAAKHDRAHESLVTQFKTRTVQKRYLAVVYGRFSEVEGMIDMSLGRHPKKRMTMSIHTRRPREAITRWKVVEELKCFTLLEVFPRTGRTHQIRVHLASMGHPILGDPTYGRKKHVRRIDEPLVRAVAEEFSRQALHAFDLSFRHPESGQSMSFRAPLANDMEEIIEFLRH
jgi:23S rRNA pseudouridine1911/1915/1917 synthase